MKRFFINSVFAALIFGHLGCAEKTSTNVSNETNTNAQTIASPTVAPTAPPEAKQAESAPVPTFTDAGEALAEGNKYFDANDNEKAIEAYRQAVKLNPDLAEAYFKLGVTYALVESEQEDAETESEKPEKTTTKKGKKDAPIIKTNSDKAFDNAIKAYKKILIKNPKDDVAHYNLGRSYNKLNQDQEAEKSLKQAVKLRPDDGDYQTELGAILIKLAHYDEAVAALKKALKIDENNLQAQELLEKAEAGRKRVDFGVNKIKQQQQLQQQQKQ